MQALRMLGVVFATLMLGIVGCQHKGNDPSSITPDVSLGHQTSDQETTPPREAAAYTDCGDLEYEIRASDDTFDIKNNSPLKCYAIASSGQPSSSWTVLILTGIPVVWDSPPSLLNASVPATMGPAGRAQNTTRSTLNTNISFSTSLNMGTPNICGVPISIAANAYPTSPSLGSLGYDENDGDINSGDRVKVTWSTSTPPDVDNDDDEITVLLEFDLNGDNDYIDAGDYVSDPDIAWEDGEFTTPMGKTVTGGTVHVRATSYDNAGASDSSVSRTYDVCSLTAPTINSATTKYDSSTYRGTSVSTTYTKFGALEFSWTAVSDADRYAIWKCQWDDGDSIPALSSWTNIAETVYTTYTATFTSTEVKHGRFLFAVTPRCSVGAEDGPESNYVMIASCNFEDTSTTQTSILDPDYPIPNGWTANSRYPDSSYNAIYWQHSGINGGVSINTKPSKSGSPNYADGWVVLNSMNLGDGSNAFFSHLRGSPVSYMEAAIKAQGAFGSNGGMCVASANGRPTDGQTTAKISGGANIVYRWADYVAGDLDYVDSTSSDLTNRIPGLTNIPGSGNWCYSAAGGGSTIYFNKWDLSPHLSSSNPYACFIEASTGNPNALVLIDDVTWLVY